MLPSGSTAPRGGFTLLEALLALTLAGILLAIALPPAGRRERRAAARVAADALGADLVRARSAGILAGETVTVRLDSLVGEWALVAADGSVLFRRRLSRGLRLHTTAYRQEIPFTSRGTSNLYSTTWIEVAADSAAPTPGIRVSPTGVAEPW